MTIFSRRDFLKITAVTGGGLMGASLFVKDGWKQPFILSDTRILMGTVIHLKVVSVDEETARNAINSTYAAMDRLAMMLTWRNPHSPLCQLNRTGNLSNAPVELLAVLAQAQKFGDLSEGAFDITVQPILEQLRAGQSIGSGTNQLVDYRKVLISGSTISFQIPGMAITLDGIAKGYVVDNGVEKLKQLGFEQVLVEAGGDLAVSSQGFFPEAWKVGIASPRPEKLDGYVAAFSITQGALATSGDYLNWFSADKSSHHIIDPAIYRSPSELASVTVYAPTATEADALSTAIMVMGTEAGLGLVNRLAQVEAMVVTKAMEIRRTKGFPDSKIG